MDGVLLKIPLVGQDDEEVEQGFCDSDSLDDDRDGEAERGEAVERDGEDGVRQTDGRQVVEEEDAEADEDVPAGCVVDHGVRWGALASFRSVGCGVWLARIDGLDVQINMDIGFKKVYVYLACMIASCFAAFIMS
jgi:hypothetical protein